MIKVGTLGWGHGYPGVQKTAGFPRILIIIDCSQNLPIPSPDIPMVKLPPRESLDRPWHRLRLYVYLLPVVGIVPACWTLWRGRQSSEGDRQSLKVSRQAIGFFLLWVSAYVLLTLGGTQAPELLSFRLIYLNGLLTSLYFLGSVLLMVGQWRRH